MQEQGGTPEQSLTPRETDILRLVAASLSNKEIANELYLALTTVKWYIRQLHSKLGTSSRKSLIRAAREIGFDENADIARIPNNLPQSMSGFIGRAAEIEQLASLITEESRQIVTLLAPGGMGKTQLALATAHHVLSEFPDGVFFVDLTPLQSSDNIASLIADVTGYQSHQDARSLQQQLADYLSDKSMLLILDNFELLLDGAGLVTDLAEHCPTLTLLITSRERLRLSRETVFALHGMSYGESNDPTGSDLKKSDIKNDAYALLEAAARRVRPDFELNEINYPSAERICQLTDGMPLAIILAMNWLELLSLAEIVTELQTSTEFLTSNLSDLPDRHSSMRAVFEPTWNRLTPEEQAVFARMSIFRGGCTREAAQSVTEASLHTLQTLVQKALISRSSEGRYSVHELLRQFTEEKLSREERETVLANHDAYFMDVVRTVPMAYADWKLQHFGKELENIKLMWFTLLDAHQWKELVAVADGITHILFGLARFDEALKLYISTRQHLKNVQPIPDDLLIRLDIYEALASNMGSQNHQLCDQNLDAVERIFISRQLQDYLYALCTGLLNSLHCSDQLSDKQCEQVEAWTLQALAIAEEVETTYPQIYFLNILSFYSRSRSSQEAHYYLSRALELGEKADSHLLGWSFEMMGYVYFHSCEYQKALDCYMKSYLDNEEKGAHAFQASHLREVAMTAFVIGDYEMAIEFYDLAAKQAGKLNWREQQLALELTTIAVTNAMKRVDISWQTLNHVNKRVLASDSRDLKNHALFAEGDILLQEARWIEAKGLFEQVLIHNGRDIYALIGLSQACYELGHTTEALQYAHYALQVAKDQQRFPADTLWDLVEFANPLPDFEKAALLSYVIHHRGTVFHMRERANRLLSEMQPINDPDWIESAKEHFLDMALDDLIDYLLEKYAPTEDTVAD